MALKYPDDYNVLFRRAWWLSWIAPRRAAAMRRLANRWRVEDNIQWLST